MLPVLVGVVDGAGQDPLQPCAPALGRACLEFVGVELHADVHGAARPRGQVPHRAAAGDSSIASTERPPRSKKSLLTPHLATRSTWANSSHRISWRGVPGAW